MTRPTVSDGPTEDLTLTFAASDFLDKVLLVLILVEIVHTVVLSLQAHALSAQPFIVVGLVAVIRKILFTLSAGQSVSVHPGSRRRVRQVGCPVTIASRSPCTPWQRS